MLGNKKKNSYNRVICTMPQKRDEIVAHCCWFELGLKCWVNIKHVN